MTSPAAITEKSWKVITISPFPKGGSTSLKKKPEVWGLYLSGTGTCFFKILMQHWAQQGLDFTSYRFSTMLNTMNQ